MTARLDYGRAPHAADALEWIEQNAPDGIALVARALSETGSAPPPPEETGGELERIEGEVIAGNVGKERTTLTVRIPGRHALLGPVTLVRRLRSLLPTPPADPRSTTPAPSADEENHDR